jgi:FdhD protein
MPRSRRTGVHRLSDGKLTIQEDALAVECLIQLSSDSDIISKLLGTPTDLRELFVGHAFAEGYGDIRASNILVETTDTGSFRARTDASITQRTSFERVVTSSCGACDTDGLEEMSSSLPHFPGPHPIYSHEILFNAFDEMRSMQDGFQETGGMHAAGLWSAEEGLHCVSEDIGRHNAVDKAIGSALLQNTDLTRQFLLLSGRCGWDLVAKASRSGIGTICCIGACSTLAADTARNLGMRIFSFMKLESCVGIGVLR